MDVYIKEGRVYGLLKNRKILKLTLDNQSRQGFTNYSLNFKSLYIRIKCSDFIEIDARNERKTEGKA